MAAPWKLGMFQSAGPMGMWKLPENRSTDYLDLEYWVTMARRCEQAGVDFLFLADDYGYPIVDDAVPPAAIRARNSCSPGCPAPPTTSNCRWR